MGSMIMDHLDSKHQVICEYTAPMEMAEMYYTVNIYSEICPIRVYMDGAYQSEWIGFIRDHSNYGGRAEKFDTDNFSELCGSIGNILNVESFPMTAVAEEFEDVMDIINDQRCCLTNAFKNDGCSETDNKQQNQDGKDFQIFKPNELGKQKNGYCHAHSLIIHKIRTLPNKVCNESSDSLCTSYTKHPPGTNINDVGLGRGSIGDHYWLGGVSPCEVDCNNNGKRYETVGTAMLP